MRSHLKVYFDFDERTEMLTDAERGRLLLAMLRYARSGEIPDLKGNERFLFPVFKGDIDRDAAAYEAHVKSGGLGGRPRNQTEPKETKGNQTETKENQNTQDRRQKTDEEEEDRGEERARGRKFTPPTVEAVAAYCLERGNRIDAAHFVDYYEARGWVLTNGKKMADWRAAVRTWEQRPNALPGGKTVSAQRYGQREYTEEELLAVSDDLMEEARARRAQ